MVETEPPFFQGGSQSGQNQTNSNTGKSVKTGDLFDASFTSAAGGARLPFRETGNPAGGVPRKGRWQPHWKD